MSINIKKWNENKNENKSGMKIRLKWYKMKISIKIR